MRKADAPAMGWYPDPRHSERLRWWDGLDWTDITRAPPSQAELHAAQDSEEQRQALATQTAMQHAAMAAAQQGGYTRQDAQAIISEVREVARSELNRASEQFTQRATTAMRAYTPLITGYTNRAIKWIKIAIGVAVFLFVAWILFQIIAQKEFFDWLGERIDNLTDEGSAPVRSALRSSVVVG